jgi:hypothetical protein
VRSEKPASDKRIEANRRNARRSTGPRTAAGKARAAQNARRHGLNVPASRDPAYVAEIAALARLIAGEGAGGAAAQRYLRACAIAAAQIDVVRIRDARRQLWPSVLETPDGIKRLAALDWYERLALARRRRAVRDFDAADVPPCGNEPNARGEGSCENEANLTAISGCENEPNCKSDGRCENEPTVCAGPPSPRLRRAAFAASPLWLVSRSGEAAKAGALAGTASIA